MCASATNIYIYVPSRLFPLREGWGFLVVFCLVGFVLVFCLVGVFWFLFVCFGFSLFVFFVFWVFFFWGGRFFFFKSESLSYILKHTQYDQ